MFYVAPPIRLKHHGLGEPGVFLTWGPLMVGGTFLAATGTIAPWVLLVSVPYALLVTSVLFGKHIDKIEADGALGVRTLPVILGEERARAVGRWLMIAFYPLTILSAAVGLIGPWVLLVVLGDPAAAGRAPDVPRPRSRPRRRPTTRRGRCGSSAGRSSTRAAPGACSRWACCSTRCCRSRCPGSDSLGQTNPCRNLSFADHDQFVPHGSK